MRTLVGSFLTHLELGQKLKKLKSFYGCNIQVSVHLSLYLASSAHFSEKIYIFHELRPFWALDIIWVVLPFLY